MAVQSSYSDSPTASRASSKSATCLRRYLVKGSVGQIARCQVGRRRVRDGNAGLAGPQGTLSRVSVFHHHRKAGNCLGSNRTRFGPRSACFCHNHNRPGRHDRSQRRWGTGRCHCPRTSGRDSGRRHPLQTPCHRSERTHLHRLNRAGHSVGGEETVPGAVLPAFRDPLRARWGNEGLRPNRSHESSHLSPERPTTARG